MLGGTKLHSAMGERTGQEEIFIAVDGLCEKERKTKRVRSSNGSKLHLTDAKIFGTLNH